MPKPAAGQNKATKPKSRMPKSASKRSRAKNLQRALAPVVERIEPPPPPARADSMKLAAEVARLEFELAVARAKMVDLAARAETDPLTDLPNRRGFERELKRSLAYVKRYGAGAALLYIDLDGFKTINDRHGHAAGDAVLRAVATVLGRHVRDSDLVARIGGDEFVLLLWNCTEADAQLKAEAVEVAVARTTATYAGQPLSVGASCGAVTLLPLDEPSTVLERADQAMYARKAARNLQRPAS